MFSRHLNWLGFVDSKRSASRRRKQKRSLGSLRIETLEIRQMLSITTATGETIAPVEGTAFGGAVATFISPDNGPFSATIDWGDGTTLSTVSGSSISGGPTPATFTVNGTHTYAEDGSKPISVVISDNSDSMTGTATGTANIAEAGLTLTGIGAVTLPEGVPESGFVATFTDPGSTDPASDFSSSINWGDGTTDSGAAVTIIGGSGAYTVMGSHEYADEGLFTITASATETSAVPPYTASAAVATITATETDVLTPVAASVSATEGSTFNGTVATFTNTGYPTNSPADFTATITWGDGSSSTGTVSGSAGALTVSGSHLFADEGSKPLTVVLADDAPGTAAATATGTATVAEADSLAASATPLTLTGVEGTSVNGSVATFTNAGYPANSASDFTAKIDWGDGTTDTGAAVTITGGSGADLTVSGSHTYAEDGAYTVTTSIADNAPGTATATATGTANVNEGSFVLNGTAPMTATEGTALSNVVVATILDPGSPDAASAFSAMIDWGDGTTDTVTPTGVTGSGNFTVAGSHTYLDEFSGNINVTVAEGNFFTIGPNPDAVTVKDADVLVPPAAKTITPTEGTTFTGTALAVFTNTGYPANAASDFNAIIDWGDGSTLTVAVTGGSGTPLTVSANHLYADEGTFTATVTLNDVSGTASASVTDTVIASEADTLAAFATPATLAGTEGSAVSGTVAVFTNTGYPANAAGDFTATVDWGDGTITTGTVSGGSGADLTVSGSHAYADDGAYTITTTIADDAPGTATAVATGTANIAESSDLKLFAAAVSATESTTFTGAVAAISDPLSPDLSTEYSATINWGDGTVTSGTVSGSSGFYPIAGSHEYLDEGNYTITVTAIETTAAPPATVSTTFSTTVAEADVLAPVAATTSGTEGTTFTGAVATFTNTGYPANAASDFTASITWGDGTVSVGTVSGSAGTLTVSGSHLYADEGSHPLTVTLSDDAPGTAKATATGTATVAEGDVLAAVAATASATEGTTFTGAVATFTNAGYPANSASDFTATITWGNGHTSVGTVSGTGNGTLTVSGSNLYADEGSYPLMVILADDAPGTAKATASGTATVAEADVLAPVLTPVHLLATEGTTFMGAVASFTNTGYPANPASDFTATIDWGDGTVTAGTVTGSAGTLTVSGSHLYADEGSNLVTVTLNDDAPGTASATATNSVTVAEHDTLVPVGTVAINATEGTTLTGALAYFVDVAYPNNPAADFTATVNWGDGQTTAGTVSGSGGIFTVSGSHLYLDELVSVPVSVIMTDDAPGTAAGTATGTANVQEADVLTATGPLTVSATERAAFTGVVATFADTGYPSNSASDFTATIDWGDGMTVAGTVSGSAGTLTVSGSHLYAEEGLFPVKITLADDVPGTASATATGTATVALPAGVGFLAGVPGDDTPQTFVQNLYRELLGREVDADSLGFWLSYLQSHDNAAGRANVISDIMDSPEYKSHYITTVYQLFLDRAPDPAGLNFWIDKMGNPGVPDQNSGSADEKYIVAAFLGSDEYYAKAGGIDQGWIKAIYQDLLGRPPQASDYNFWENELQTRGPGDRDGIVRDLLTSPEAAHDLLDSFYPAAGGTASTPLAKPGTLAGVGLDDLSLLTGAGWENLYLEGPYDSQPEGNDAFFAALAGGGSWDDTQLLILNTTQFYSNPNTPVTKPLA